MTELVMEYIREMKLTTGFNTHRIFEAWDQVSGASRYTISRFYRDGMLYCTISSSVVRNQLYFQKDVLVQKFLNETSAVLRNIGRFFQSSAVYIVECDEHVQNVVVIHDPAELDNYASGFQVKGGFGTDFRPVFAWVDQQRRAGEIEDMEALMYFTDGMGVYPEKPTDYDTAFVFFNDEELDDTKVPDWAVRLYIDGEKVRM
jgi:hypothetical protein